MLKLNIVTITLLFSTSLLLRDVRACQTCSSSQTLNEIGVVGHNELRAKHSSGALSPSDALTTTALNCAQFYCHNSGSIEAQSCPSRTPGTGENIAHTLKDPNHNGPEKLIAYAIEHWYGESSKVEKALTYEGGLKSVKHFTQMLWAASTRVGFAVCTCDDDSVVVVAHYDNAQAIIEPQCNANANSTTENAPETTTAFETTAEFQTTTEFETTADFQTTTEFETTAEIQTTAEFETTAEFQTTAEFETTAEIQTTTEFETTAEFQTTTEFETTTSVEIENVTEVTTTTEKAAFDCSPESYFGMDLGVCLHNKYRAQHGIPPMAQNYDLADTAVACAEYYCTHTNKGASCPTRPAGFGENVHTFIQSEHAYGADPYEDATKTWYDQGTDAFHILKSDKLIKYDYNDPKCTLEANTERPAKFTQMLWKEATEMGFGVVGCSGDVQVLVAHYNVAQRSDADCKLYKENVLPPLP